MPVRSMSSSPLKAVYTVTETANGCGLSRARFYELIHSGVMPYPCYDPRTHKPLYPAELHDLCVRVRQTNVGMDGRYVMFYTRRHDPEPAAHQPRRAPRRATASDNRMGEIVEQLRALGVTAPESRITEAVATCYPAGLPEGQFEAALRTIFLHLRRLNVA